MKKMIQTINPEIPFCAALLLAAAFVFFTINWQFISDIQYELNRFFSSYSSWFKGF